MEPEGARASVVAIDNGESGRRRRRSRRAAGTAVSPAYKASFGRWSAEVARDNRARAVVTWVAIILIFRQTLAAPIRAYVPALWYGADLLMGLALLVVVAMGLRSRVISVLVAVGLVGLLVTYSAILNTPFAAATGIRGLGYILLAYFAALGMRRSGSPLPLALVAAAIISMIGVYWEDFFHVPWAGIQFEGVGGTADVSRQWTSDGVRRLSGFGIGSTDTSIIIAAGTLVFFGLTRNRVRISNLAFCAVAVHTLILTTQKATAAWLIITALAAYISPIIAFRLNGFQAARVLKPLGIAGLVLCIAVPPLFAGVEFGHMFGLNTPTLDQRMDEVWPGVMPYIFKFPQILLGYGLGGIGPFASNPSLSMVDNMFLFTALSIGLPLTIALFLIAARAIWAVRVRDGVDFSALAIVTLLILNGITANIVVSGAVASIFLGYGIGCLLRPGDLIASEQRSRRRRRGSSSFEERSTRPLDQA